MTSKVTPFLWFNTQAEEATNLYISIFPNSKIISTMPGPGGSVMGVTFELDGTVLTAFNGGPEFKFTEAISLCVDCETQAEVDEFWEKLVAGGEPSQCGWLKDKYGLSWQIIPRILPKLLADPDPVKAKKAMEAMLKMSKIDIAELERAVGQA